MYRFIEAEVGPTGTCPLGILTFSGHVIATSNVNGMKPLIKREDTHYLQEIKNNFFFF